jgi:hypothetical protein
MDEFDLALGADLDLEDAADFEAELDRRGGVEAAFRAIVREELETFDGEGF